MPGVEATTPEGKQLHPHQQQQLRRPQQQFRKTPGFLGIEEKINQFVQKVFGQVSNYFLTIFNCF